jgi:hypothetical protein
MKGLAVSLAVLLLVEGCAASIGRTSPEPVASTSASSSDSVPAMPTRHMVWPYWTAAGVALAAAATVGVVFLVANAIGKGAGEAAGHAAAGAGSSSGNRSDSPRVLALTVTR